jgi:hypothetical protein
MATRLESDDVSWGALSRLWAHAASNDDAR